MIYHVSTCIRKILLNVIYFSPFPIGKSCHGPREEAEHPTGHHVGGVISAVKQRISTVQNAPEEVWEVHVWKYSKQSQRSAECESAGCYRSLLHVEELPGVLSSDCQVVFTLFMKWADEETSAGKERVTIMDEARDARLVLLSVVWEAAADTSPFIAACWWVVLLLRFLSLCVPLLQHWYQTKHANIHFLSAEWHFESKCTSCGNQSGATIPWKRCRKHLFR